MAATSHTTAHGPSNLAARMGRWSASHRKLALFGWLAFVLVALVLGGAVATTTLGDAEGQSGEAGRAAKLYAAAGLDGGDPESVLVQSRALRASDPEFVETVRDVERAIARQPGVGDLRSPYGRGGHGRISADGHSVLIGFRLGARPDPRGRPIGIEPVRDAVEGTARAHPGFYSAGTATRARTRWSPTRTGATSIAPSCSRSRSRSRSCSSRSERSSRPSSLCC
jgi:putative drug exporter of the RND superfamily